MTTSGVATFNPVRDQIVHGALRLVGAYASTDTPRAEQVNDAVEALAMILTSFQVEGFLWLKTWATLALVAGQNKYLIPGADCVTDDDIPIDRPMRITYPMRRTASGQDIPMGETGRPLTREEYASLPNKNASGTPIHCYYDPQMSVGVLYVWPTPTTADDSIRFSCDRPIQDMVSDTDTFDVPREQVRRLKYALAIEIAPEYALPAAEFARLESRYAQIASALSDFDQDFGGTQIQMGRR